MDRSIFGKKNQEQYFIPIKAEKTDIQVETLRKELDRVGLKGKELEIHA